jgi:dolichyl-phosphate-mannose--protein O-mannosyl transferase
MIEAAMSGLFRHRRRFVSLDTQAVSASACALVMLVAAFLSFNRMGEVRAPIWDEAYYLTTTARYHEGRMQFASHPPLGLMLIAAGDGLSGLNKGIDWRPMAVLKSIKTEQMPRDFDYRGPRLAPALFATIAAGLFFLLLLELTGSTGAALLLSPLFLCDTALIAQFRAAQLDAFQIAFALAAMICAIRGRRKASPGWAIGFGFTMACTALVRANGIILAPMGVFLVWPALRSRDWQRAAAIMTGGVSAALAALVMVATAHVLASPLPPDPASEAGRTDLRYLPSAPARTGAARIAEVAASYSRFMAADLAGMARSDANASHPMQWLLGIGTITYRWDRNLDSVSTIALVPNYAAWLVSLLGVIAAIWSLRRTFSPERAMLLTGWFANMLALQWLDGGRVLYLYHYFLPLIIGHALAAVAWRDSGFRERPALAAITGVTVCFALIAPLALHQQVPKTYCQIFLRVCAD